jgi:arsenate reductase
VFRDIKQDPLTAEELEEMYQLSGSYEALFSKKKLYKSMNLKDKSLTEEDYKKYILEHYTFFLTCLSLIMVFTLAEQQNMLKVMKALANV